MNLPSFNLEEYFAKYEFSAPYLICMSDCEPFSMREILDLADNECLKLWDNLSLGYSETMGHPLLREQISHQYEKIPPKNVLCHAGAEEAIYCTMRSLLQKGDHVIVITPCYQSLEALPRSITNNVTTISLKPEKQWNLEIDVLRTAIQENTKMIVMNYPHNPTGALLDKEDLQSVIEIARKQGCYIVCDEVYRLMEIDSKDRLPNIADAFELGISINVMTKAFGLGGLRIGWIVSQNIDVIQKVSTYKHYTSICNSVASEILAIIALRVKSYLLDRNYKIMMDNLKLIDKFFEKYADLFSWTRPKGACIGFVRLSDSIPVEPLSGKLVEKAGVLILPASIYSYPGNYFRIGFGRKDFSEAFSKFESFVVSDCV